MNTLESRPKIYLEERGAHLHRNCSGYTGSSKNFSAVFLTITGIGDHRLLSRRYNKFTCVHDSMQLKSFCSLVENQGDEPTEVEVYSIEVNQEDYDRAFILQKVPDGVAPALYQGKVWMCWTQDMEEPAKSLEALEGQKGYSGKLECRTINLLEDEWWSNIGYRLIRNGLINNAYNCGFYFKDDNHRLCLGKKYEEKKGRSLRIAMSAKVFRNTDKNNFYISLDVQSSVSKEENPPEAYKNDRLILDLTPDSAERRKRLEEFLDPMTDDEGKLSFFLNNTEIVLGSCVEFSEEVERR